MNQIMTRVCQFLGQPDNQKNAITVYFCSAIIMVIIMLFPIRHYYENNKKDYLEQRNISRWLSQHAEQLQLVSSSQHVSEKQPKTPAGKSIFSIISETSKKDMLSRIEQHGSTVVATAERVSLSDLLSWLSKISAQHGIGVQYTAIAYIENDTVSGQIIFSQ